MNVLVKRIDVGSAVEYEQIRELCLDRHKLNSFTEFCVPASRGLDRDIGKFFLRSGIKLYAIKEYRYANTCFALYKFNRYYVFIEISRPAIVQELRFSRDVDRWVRLGIVRSIFAKDKLTKYILEKGVGREWVCKVSDMLRRYAENANDMTFTDWANKDHVMKNMMVYKSTHVAKGNLLPRSILNKQHRQRMVMIGPNS